MSALSRREFLKGLAAAGAVGAAGVSGCGESPQFVVTGSNGVNPGKRPNILLVLSDEFNHPPKYPEGTGMPRGLREILGFEQGIADDNPFRNLFPGFLRLRENAVAFRRHYTASAACVPSRASLLTGQYPTVHNTSQTTGIFKEPSDPGFVYLDPDGIPTVGDWFQAAGYETFYFGKWHVSEACHDLGPWGFPYAAWDGPEPHGSDVANLGVYRDKEFADSTIEFLNSRGGEQPEDAAPWFAVSSFVAPHDVSGWPLQWFLPGNAGVQNTPPNFQTPPPIPSTGAISNPATPNPTDAASDCPPPSSGPVELNPGGYPAGVFKAVPTLQEDLTTKPDCQYDMSIKFGLAQKANLPEPVRPLAPNPFQLTGPEFEAWTTAYGEWWTYLHYVLDIQLNRVFQALDANGLRENTIVIFTCDHGDYAGAHGGMVQKWHTAYEEAIRVPFVVSSPLVNPEGQLKEFGTPTSHIDLLPTLLGLAGFKPAEQEQIRQKITGQGVVPPLVGTDISSYVTNPQSTAPIPNSETGQPRPGVLFMTVDTITEMTTVDPSNERYEAYQTYLGLVEQARLVLPRLASGPVRHPNLIRTLIDESWKYSRYYDPNGVEADQYEFYHLPSDPVEAVNLVDYKSGALRAGLSVPGVSQQQLEAQLGLMKDQLAQQEALLL